jgi:hypothetical protein
VPACAKHKHVCCCFYVVKTKEAQDYHPLLDFFFQTTFLLAEAKVTNAFKIFDFNKPLGNQ